MVMAACRVCVQVYIGVGSMDQAGKGVDTYSRSCRRAAEAADACSCFRFAEDGQRARSMQTCCIMRADLCMRVLCVHMSPNSAGGLYNQDLCASAV